MKIGIGLPNPIPGANGRAIVAWASRAEERSFSTLGTIDRIAYPSYESIIALAAAAGATERIGLLTNILLSQTRNPVLLAKEAASLDQLSGGRFTLGIGVGGREDDFVAARQEFHNRGRRMDADLDLMHRAWRGEPVAGSSKPVTPTPTNGQSVPIIIGGGSDVAFERAVKWGIGWTAGGGGPERAAPAVEKIRRMWKEAGREGEPQLIALHYFALGPNAEEGALAYLSDYYGDWGPMMAQTAAKTPEAIRQTARLFEEAGFTELIFDPTIADPSQVDLLADALG
jgi:alkanesulfonate monooxygenase SsuD/methylene tetrahydromethanopterin reductase-like flavin-dependent oxidoreductase (luciferase family)